MRKLLLLAVMLAACGGEEGGGNTPADCTDVDTLNGPRELCAIDGRYPDAPEGCFRFTVDPATSEDTAIFCPPAEWQGDWFSWRTETPCRAGGRSGWHVAIRVTETGSRPGEASEFCALPADCMRDAVLGNAACCADTKPGSAPLYWNCDGSPI